MFVLRSGIGSAQTESEEKVILVSESRFGMRKNEKKSIFSKPPQCPILSFWILNLHIIIRQFKKKIHRDTFFLSHCMFLPLPLVPYKSSEDPGRLTP